MSQTPPAPSTMEGPPRKTEMDRWNECYKSGLDLLLGGILLGSIASIVTLTPFPFVVLSTIGLYSAVENCDNIFKQQIPKEIKATYDDEK